jgi:hypothetical protein
MYSIITITLPGVVEHHLASQDSFEPLCLDDVRSSKNHYRYMHTICSKPDAKMDSNLGGTCRIFLVSQSKSGELRCKYTTLANPLGTHGSETRVQAC